MISYNVTLTIIDDLDEKDTATVCFYHVPHSILLLILSALESAHCVGTVLSAAGTLWPIFAKGLDSLSQSPAKPCSGQTKRGKG